MTDDTTTAGATPTDEAWAPARMTVIDGAEAIKALADPLRLQILQLTMTASERSWSVKEIAAELNQPVTKLYHHVKILESAALITDVETRVVSGIVEHRYRCSQKGLRFDDVALFGTPETRSDSIAQIAALVDTSRDDLIDYLSLEDVDIDLVTVSRARIRLTAQELAIVNAKIDELLEGFRAFGGDTDRSAVPHSSMLFVVHPLAHDPS
jgi:DNA-binding transcriptional ArsR family regulator